MKFFVTPFSPTSSYFVYRTNYVTSFQDFYGISELFLLFHDAASTKRLIHRRKRRNQRMITQRVWKDAKVVMAYFKHISAFSWVILAKSCTSLPKAQLPAEIRNDDLSNAIQEC
jgi:hypothetical protein